MRGDVLIAIVVLGAVSFFVWLYIASMGVPRRPSELGPSLLRLLEIDRLGAFILLQRPFSDRFLQIGKYVEKDGEVGLELSIPDVPWSHSYIPQIVKEAARRGMVHFSKADESREVTFLIVQFGKEVTLVEQFSSWILCDVMGYPREPKMRVRIEFA